MGILTTTLVLPAAAMLTATPEATTVTLAVSVVALGIKLHAALPPPAEDTTEAILLAAMATM
ncbi:hypothetical protein E2C06_20490 [Dankookia rubra]|uniref:Uncharacterized protein n=1 Tax=Dankookia rubra TaxID=1442381 RepID=A0A4R5QDN9_9PROT|nr:hypothetical protein [Dankookia rubra]TDH60748.1 hypothetical protein E2C06_20490 [Dankookia rubra]